MFWKMLLKRTEELVNDGIENIAEQSHRRREGGWPVFVGCPIVWR